MPDYLELLTAKQAADEKGVSRRAIYDAIKTGKLPAIRHGREWLIKRADLDKYKVHRHRPPKEDKLPPEEESS